MNENFRNEYNEIKNQSLLAVNAYYFSHMEELTASFGESLKAACERVMEMQEQGYPDVEYMEITLLRTRLMEHQYRVPILVYGTEWYADLGQAQVGEMDAGGIFSFYETMIQAAASLVKKYRTKLPERMLETCMCSAAELFWNYVEMACRRAVMGFTPNGMGITEEFRIRACEYMGYGSVCRRYTPEMTRNQMKKWFDKKEEEEYRFRDYRGHDFSGWDFSGLNLTGCDFSGCTLDGCSFEHADLTGAWFCGSSMKEVNAADAWLPGAKFDGANLQEAVFEGAYSSCKINDQLWLRPDNEWASFTGCCLKSADFSFSAIECADFTGADLEGAIFNDAHRDYYQMDERQRERAKFRDF